MRPWPIVLLCLLAAPALAADGGKWPVNRESCVGAYGALDNQGAILSVVMPERLKGNIGAIDWAARRAAVLRGSSVIEAASAIYLATFDAALEDFQTAGPPAEAEEVFKLAAQCDRQFGQVPALTARTR
mgnify:CR=1 FL=1|jgi:hypothetical protein